MCKTIVVACGMGVVSSSIMRQSLQELLWRERIEASIIICRHSQLWQHLANADLIISAITPEIKTHCPVVIGVGFITGVGVEELEQSILYHLTAFNVKKPAMGLEDFERSYADEI